jgi:hypothetical protein
MRSALAFITRLVPPLQIGVGVYHLSQIGRYLSPRLGTSDRFPGLVRIPIFILFIQFRIRRRAGCTMTGTSLGYKLGMLQTYSVGEGPAVSRKLGSVVRSMASFTLPRRI